MLEIAARRLLLVLFLGLLAAPAALAQCPASTPLQGGVPPGPLPLFPAGQLVEPRHFGGARSTRARPAYIAFINNGGTRRLHPDFGGEVSPGSVDIYGMPYAIVDGTQPKQAVTFDYWDESDGVNPATGRRASRSIRFPRRRSRSRTGSRAARRATSTSAARAIATC